MDRAKELHIDTQPWDGEGRGGSVADEVPIGAMARLCYNVRALYVRYDVRDEHQQATTTTLNCLGDSKPAFTTWIPLESPAPEFQFPE